MKKIKSQIAINLLASLLAYGVNFCITFLLTPYIIKCVGRESYGFVGLANNFVEYVSIVTAALNSVAGRFITVSLHRDDYDTASGYFSSVLFANILMSVPLTVFFAVLIAKMSAFLDISPEILPSIQLLWAFIFVNFLLTLIGNVFSVATYTKNRLDLTSERNIVTSFLRVLILVVTFHFFPAQVWYLGLATLICGIFNLVTNTVFTRRLVPELRIDRNLLDLKKISELISVGIWNSISRLSSVILEELDLLITNLFVNASAMGSVSLAKRLPTYMLTIFTLFGSAYGPQLTICYAKEDFEGIRDELLSSIRVIAIFSSVPLACLYAFGQDFFALWVPSENAHQLAVLAILGCLEFPLVVPTVPMWVAFPVANKTRQPAIFGAVTAAVSVTLTFFLLKMAYTEFQKMCIIVGVSSCLGLIRGGIFLPLFGAYCFHFKWTTFYPPLIKSLVALLCSTGAGLLIRQLITPCTWLLFLLCCTLTGAFSLIFYVFILMNREERHSVISRIQKKKD